MKINRLSIIGLGLIGSSIALAARRKLKHCEIIGYDKSEKVRKAAVSRRVLDQTTTSAAAAAGECDLLIVAVPVDAAKKTLRQIAKTLPVGAVVTDTCSTKASIVTLATRELGGRFVGSHPMFGSEKGGIENADAALLKGAKVLITPAKGTDPDALRAVESFWKSLGLRPMQLDPADHDRRLALASHLPQVLASVLMAQQTKDSIAVAGRGLIDTTRLAGSDGKLWESILLDNPAISEELERTAVRLMVLAKDIRDGEGAGIRKTFSNAQRRRERFLKGV